jgi:hypothetical protein
MSKFFLSILISFFTIVVNQPLLAKIESIDCLQQFINAAQELPKDSLVIFDIDRTLLLMEDCILKPGKKSFLTQLDKIAAANGYTLNSETRNLLLSKALLATTHALVEPCVVEFIQQLKSRQIKTMALTGGTPTGRLGDIPRMEKWRQSTLQQVGIDFSGAFAAFPEIRFSQDQVEAPAVFYQGILNASLVPKGKALMAFLQAVSFTPQLVIMLDDQPAALASVESALREKGIDFRGYQYNYVENSLRSCETASCSGEQQILHLLKHQVWLRDSFKTNKCLLSS